VIARATMVARYTLVEQRRRRLLLAFVVIEVLLAAGIGIAPFVIGAGSTGEERALFLLSALGGVVSPALFIFAIAVGMTILRHDVDSGALAAILAKPLSRTGYASGKLLAAAALLGLVGVVFAASCAVLLALDGGGHVGVFAVYLVVNAANAALVMVLVMILSVYASGVLAALGGIGLVFVLSIVSTLHTAEQGGMIRSELWRAVVDVAYGVLPRALTSNLERDIVQTSLRLHPNAQPAFPPGSVPGPSSMGDIVAWAVWVTALCVALGLAVRRKQI
jgi:ABC-type transport system involved in multi-copper enzyme maturation permease subunit